MEPDDLIRRGFTGVEVDEDLVYSGTLYYIELLKDVMDQVFKDVLNHDVENARYSISMFWTLVQPFDLEEFVERSQRMGGATTIDAARQITRMWLNPDGPDPVPTNKWQAEVDALFVKFNAGVIALIRRLMPEVQVYDVRLGPYEEEG